MIAGVADTHAALWYLFGDPRLSASAKSAFDTAASHRRKIVLSVISLAEMVYLVEKNPFPRLRMLICRRCCTTPITFRKPR
jgi:PIN domain nuclease of toxin-antitoxin system